MVKVNVNVFGSACDSDSCSLENQSPQWIHAALEKSYLVGVVGKSHKSSVQRIACHSSVDAVLQNEAQETVMIIRKPRQSVASSSNTNSPAQPGPPPLKPGRLLAAGCNAGDA